MSPKKLKLFVLRIYWETKLNKKVLDIVKIDIEGHELASLKGF